MKTCVRAMLSGFVRMRMNTVLEGIQTAVSERAARKYFDRNGGGQLLSDFIFDFTNSLI